MESIYFPPEGQPCPENLTMFQGFEWYIPADHKHWVRLAGVIPSLANLGITGIWIPPAGKAASQKTNGYDTYDLYDLGEFKQKGGLQTKWGTKAELATLVEAANACGVRILFDAVLNHKAAADHTEVAMATRVNPKNRMKEDDKLEEVVTWTKFDFPGRGGMYSTMKWNQKHFTGTDWDHKSRSKGIWKFEGKKWAQDVDEELDNYDYLMFADIDHSHPEVRRDLFHWVSWLAEQFNLGGLRIDAIKHFSATFLRDFIRHIDRTIGEDWFMVGEYWREDASVLAKYIEYMNHRISIFDVPLLGRFHRVSLGLEPDLRSVFHDTLVSSKPKNAVTFVANHDTQLGQALETPIAPFFVPIAYALILLRADFGMPCVFWGDLYGTLNPAARMPPSSGGQILPRLLLARRLWAYGAEASYLSDSTTCLGFTRLGHPSRAGGAGLAVVVNTAWEFSAKRMRVGRRHAAERWSDVLRQTWGEVEIDDEGFGLFSVGPRSVSVWVSRQAEGRDMVDEFLL